MAKKIIKRKPAEKIEFPKWYKNQVFEYGKNLDTKGKVVAYFKMEAGRRGRATRGGRSKRQVTKFIKLFENGMAVYIDITMWSMAVTQSFGTPFQLRNSDKREFDKVLKTFLRAII